MSINTNFVFVIVAYLQQQQSIGNQYKCPALDNRMHANELYKNKDDKKNYIYE